MLASYLEPSGVVLQVAAKNIGEETIFSALGLLVNALKSGKPMLN